METVFAADNVGIVADQRRFFLLCNTNVLHCRETQQLAINSRRKCKVTKSALYVSSGVWSIYFVLGLGFGSPTVMIPQIRREANSTEAVTEEMASWLSSVHGYSALLWVFIIGFMTKYLGRRIPFLLVCVNTLASFILFYCSTNTTHLLISAIMQGMLLGSNFTVLIVIITEYSSPRYRGVFAIFKSTMFFWGVLVANATGAFSHWKNIGIIAFICSIYPLSAAFWPESPYWLAMKGRFDECIVAHHWLKGFDKESVYELETLIQSQKDYRKMCIEEKSVVAKNCLRIGFDMISTKSFYMPMLLSISIMSLFDFSGKLVSSMYVMDVMKEITGNQYTSSIGMLIIDAVTIIAMQVGCALSRFLKRRTLLLSSAAAAIIFLYIISVYLFLIKFSVFVENKHVSIMLLTLFSISVSIGPMIMPATLLGELICLRYQTSCLIILTLISLFLMSTILKMTPYIFKTLTLPGVFCFFGICSSVFWFIIYKYLPETKGKTLYEIENYFKESRNSRNAE